MEQLYKVHTISLKGKDTKQKTLGKGVILFLSDLVYLVGNPVVKVQSTNQLAFKSEEGSKIVLKEI